MKYDWLCGLRRHLPSNSREIGDRGTFYLEAILAESDTEIRALYSIKSRKVGVILVLTRNSARVEAVL